jgi:hypothetical protein
VKATSGRVIVCAMVALTVGCKPQASSLPKPMLSLSQNKFDDQTLNLIITNLSTEMLCVSAVYIDTGWGSVVLKQAGKEIYPNTQANRKIRVVKDVDVLAPIYVIMPGKNDFYYDIADYEVAKGQFEASLDVKVFACKDFFDGGFVRWLPVSASMQGTLTEFRAAAD